MRIIFAFAWVALAVSGCSDQSKVAGEGETKAQPEACVDKPFYSPFPSEIRLDMPIHFRSDLVFKKKSGEVRRAVTVEYLTGDGNDAQRAIKGAMAAAGYAPRAGKNADKGKTMRQAYVSEGRKSFWVVISPTPGKRPSNPDAKGTIAVSWQLAPAPKREQPQEGDAGPSGTQPAGSNE